MLTSKPPIEGKPIWKPVGKSVPLRNNLKLGTSRMSQLIPRNLDGKDVSSSMSKVNGIIRHSQLRLHKGQPEFLSEMKINAKRNMQVSQQLLDIFKPRRIPRVLHHQKELSENLSSFRIPFRSKSIPIRHSGYKTIIDMSKEERGNLTGASRSNFYETHESDVWEALDAEALSKIQKLKSKILSGQYVSMADISALKGKLRKQMPKAEDGHSTVQNPEEKSEKNHRRKPPSKKTVYCEKGIAYIATPHGVPPKSNTFGSPADLRISLSNSDTPEYRGRRRFYFDFTGFEDRDIKLWLEGNRRLVLQGERTDSLNKPAMKVTDFIDLPKDLSVDNLRIVRDAFGTMIVEEAWKFL